MYPFYLYNPVIELPQPVIIPIKSVEYFVLKNEAKQLRSKQKSVLKMHNIAHSDQKENKSGLMDTQYIKINLTVVFPKPIINHDFKKKVDLAKKRNRKLKETARNFVVPDLFEQKPKSFEQRKAENLEWLEFFYELDQERPIIRPTLSEWVIAKKAAELTFERKNAEQVWKMYQQKAIDWDKESAKLLKQKTKELDMIGLDDLYEQTHNMRDVINVFNQKNR